MFVVPKGLIESIIGIIYPSFCIGCKKPNHHTQNNECLCNECYLSIERHSPPFCSKCGRGLTEIKNSKSGLCKTCLNKKYYFQNAFSVCRYEGVIKELIHQFKYNQKLQYSIIFEKLFNEFIDTFKILGDIDLIIPVPLHPVRLREREYNQSQILASMVAKIIQRPVAADILERIRNTKYQIELNEQDRIKNIEGCFRINDSIELKSKSLLLIDDVLTTGVTLSEAAKAINRLNPNKIYALTLAS